MDILIRLKQGLVQLLIWLNEGLLYFTSFVSALVLFAGAIGVTVWLLMKFWYWFATDTRATDKAAPRGDPNAHKRAGQ